MYCALSSALRISCCCCWHTHLNSTASSLLPCAEEPQQRLERAASLQDTSSGLTPAARPPKLKQCTQGPDTPFHARFGHVSTICHTAASKERKRRSVIEMETSAQSHVHLTRTVVWALGECSRMLQIVTADIPYNKSLKWSLITSKKQIFNVWTLRLRPRGSSMKEALTFLIRRTFLFRKEKNQLLEVKFYFKLLLALCALQGCFYISILDQILVCFWKKTSSHPHFLTPPTLHILECF